MSESSVSVVIPSYNHATFVVEAIESVLRQTHRDLEVIVVDDGSNDRSTDRVSKIRDERLRLELQENRGAHAAINRGLELARGNVLTILNSDDVYVPWRLERLLELLHMHPEAGVACSWIEVIDAAGKRLALKRGYKNLEPWLVDQPTQSFQATDDLTDNLLMWNYISTTSNLAFRRETFQTVGHFRNLRYAHDWDWALRASSTTRFALIEEPLLRYRVHAANTIRENREAMIFEILLVLADNYHRFAVHDRLDLRDSRALAQRAARHFHSLHTFGNDRLFFVLHFLIEAARTRNMALADDLMRPEHPTRIWFLEQIADTERKR